MLNGVDKAIAEGYYATRSEVVRDALRRFSGSVTV
jgi:Arc/MetJ-type ribon-helix-helix transcriptional regulator